MNFILDLLKLQCPQLFTVPDRASRVVTMECDAVVMDFNDVMNSFLQGMNEQLLDCMEDIVVSLGYLYVYTNTFHIHRAMCITL